jgi:hypothetical protein
MTDAVVQQAVANTRRECAEIVAACHLAGDIRLATRFIEDCTPLYAVKRQLAENSRGSDLGSENAPAANDIAAAIRASGRAWPS